jgi:hypothetical protein
MRMLHRVGLALLLISLWSTNVGRGIPSVIGIVVGMALWIMPE